MRHLLKLVPIGSAPPALLHELEEPIRAQLGMETVVDKNPLPHPTYAFNKDRGQYHSTAIVRRVVGTLEPDHRWILGMADVDLFMPETPFVFGEADRAERVAIFSLTRLREGAVGDTLRRRVQVEGVHQAGHLLGLSFCEDARCVMFMAQSVADCDKKGLTVCNVCRNELAKIQRA